MNGLRRLGFLVLVDFPALEMLLEGCRGLGVSRVAIPGRIGSLHWWGVIGGNANACARHFSKPPGWEIDNGPSSGKFIASQRWLL